MWLGIGVLLLIVWGVSFLIFKVAGFAIHLLIIGAVIAGIVQLIQWIRHKNDG